MSNDSNPEVRVSHHLVYHVQNNIPLHQNVFRYGSKAWADLLCEARRLYNEGLITELDEEDFLLLESDAGERAKYAGKEVLLDTPEPNWDVPGESIVFVRTEDGSIERVTFVTG